MFISIPKEFFVPVLYSDEFRYNIENDSMEYDTEARNINPNIGEENLSGINFIKDTRQDGEFTTKHMEKVENIAIEEQLIEYVTGFMKFINELKNSNCLGTSEEESIKLINYYARSFRKLYDDFIMEISNVRRTLSQADVGGFLDYYIGKLEDIFNKNLAELNCKGLNYDTIEGTIDEILNDAREILKEEIRNLNCMMVNKETPCKSYKDIENTFMTEGNIYNTIDNEFVQEMAK